MGDKNESSVRTIALSTLASVDVDQALEAVCKAVPGIRVLDHRRRRIWIRQRLVVVVEGGRGDIRRFRAALQSEASRLAGSGASAGQFGGPF